MTDVTRAPAVDRDALAEVLRDSRWKRETFDDGDYVWREQSDATVADALLASGVLTDAATVAAQARAKAGEDALSAVLRQLIPSHGSPPSWAGDYNNGVLAAAERVREVFDLPPLNLTRADTGQRRRG